MLDSTVSSHSLSKADYRRRLAKLEARVSELQNKLRDTDRTALIVVEGPDEAGKTTVAQRLLESLDPRGFRVWHTYAADPHELHRPWLWRFWMRTPRRGSMACFDRSWYGRVLVERVEGFATGREVERAYGEINAFEKALTDEGAVILKVLMNLSKREQRKRYEACESDPNQRWRIRKEDWRAHRKFGRYRRAFRDMVKRTSTARSPWIVIPADDRRTAETLALEAIVRGLAKGLR